MGKTRIITFESIILIVWIAVAAMGFQLINMAHSSEVGINWLMVIAIFSWLILLILFISLSLILNTTKKQLEEVKKIVEELKHTRRKLI